MASSWAEASCCACAEWTAIPRSMARELRVKISSNRREVLQRVQAVEKLSSSLNILITSSVGRSASCVDCLACPSMSL